MWSESTDEDEVQTGTRHVRRLFLYLNSINKLFVFMTELLDKQTDV